jgi:hypothetical protein
MPATNDDIEGGKRGASIRTRTTRPRLRRSPRSIPSTNQAVQQRTRCTLRHGTRGVRSTDQQRRASSRNKDLRWHKTICPSGASKKHGKQVAYLEESKLSSDEDHIKKQMQRHVPQQPLSRSTNSTNELHATRAKHAAAQRSQKSIKRIIFNGRRVMESERRRPSAKHYYNTPPPSP